MGESRLHIPEVKPKPHSDGFFICQRCQTIATPSEAEIERAENATPCGQIVLKCPHCHKYTVKWQPPAPAPLSEDRRAQIFAEMRRIVELA